MRSLCYIRHYHLSNMDSCMDLCTNPKNVVNYLSGTYCGPNRHHQFRVLENMSAFLLSWMNNSDIFRLSSLDLDLAVRKTPRRLVNSLASKSNELDETPLLVVISLLTSLCLIDHMSQGRIGERSCFLIFSGASSG